MGRLLANLIPLLVLLALSGQFAEGALRLKAGALNENELQLAREAAPRKPKTQVAQRASPRQLLASGEADQLAIMTERANSSMEKNIGRVVDVMAYLPDESFLALGTADDARELEAIEGIRMVAVMPSVGKISALLRSLTSDEQDEPSTMRDRLSDAGVVWRESLPAEGEGKYPVAKLGIMLPPNQGSRKSPEMEDVAPFALSMIRHTLRCEPLSETGCESAVLIAPDTLAMEVSARNASTISWVVESLSKIRTVHFVEPLLEAVTQNAEVSSIVQNFQTTGTPIWDAGLDGSGVLVASADTGVDIRHCLFRDQWDSVGANHRKIEAYRSIAGDSRDRNGHGTHVLGTLLGSSSTSRQTGVAKGARAIVTDMSSGLRGALQTPNDLQNGYLQPVWDLGARITSESWAMQTQEYTRSSQEVDWFQYENNGMLTAFAAGNNGDSGYNTVRSPGNAKNALTVGASLNARSRIPPDIARPESSGFAVSLESTGSPVLDGTRIGILPAGTSFPEGRVTVSPANPFDACSGVKSAKGTVLVASRSGGDCSDRAKAQNAAQAGAKALLLVEDGQTCGTRQVGPIAASIPTGSVSRKDGGILRDLGGTKATISRLLSSDEPWKAAIAGFSSRGPTSDGRVKPDILTPGDTVRSAEAGSGCGTSLKSGTSMATPAAAGAAAIVRQFLEEGRAKGSDTTKPSGALVKALLINGAEGLERGFAMHNGQTRPVESSNPFPSCEQGFGAVHLEQSLQATSVMAFDKGSLADEADTWEVCAQVGSGGGEEVRVTLAWHDHPATLASELQLVNDLDLSATGAGVSWPIESRDRRNNVERLVVTGPSPGQLRVTVSAHRLLTDQPFSLVISGDVSEC